MQSRTPSKLHPGAVQKIEKKKVVIHIELLMGLRTKSVLLVSSFDYFHLSSYDKYKILGGEVYL